MKQRVIRSPIGRMLLSVRAGALCEVRMLTEDIAVSCADPLLDEAEHQVMQYFAGERTAFDLPLSLRGTDFERAVWQQLMRIPFGEIRTYGQIAALLGKPKASRAVGSACSKNPMLIVVPCHRVVGSAAKLTGFSAGMQVKRRLLELEGWRIHGEQIEDK